ncbi:MAG: ACP phosphodiesterase [Planctomycetota bacterium]
MPLGLGVDLRAFRLGTCDNAAVNFLAHLALAGVPTRVTDAGHAAHATSSAVPDPLTLVGSLLPDLARDTPAFRGRRGETHPDLPAAVRHGIALHRRVDRATDTHPAFLRTRARLAPRYGRFAGVVADVLFDYALSLRWDDPKTRDHAAAPRDFPPISRPDFIAAAHAALQSPQARDAMPPAMARTVDAMIEHGWLLRYADPTGLERTFFELSIRFTRRYARPADLTDITAHLDEHRDALLADFDSLWRHLVDRLADQEN